MALPSTLYNFDIQLADADRGVYASPALRVACHPSESPEHLVARVLAYALEFTEGIAFSKGGVSDPDEPAIAVRDLTGALRAWIEVGAPDAARLHKATKAAPRVAVYVHKDPAAWLRGLAGERIHRAGEVEVYGLDRDLIAGIVARLERRVKLDLSVTGRHLYVTIGGESMDGGVEKYSLESG